MHNMTITFFKWFIAFKLAGALWTNEEEDGTQAKHLCGLYIVTQDGLTMFRVVVWRLAVWVGRWSQKGIEKQLGEQ